MTDSVYKFNNTSDHRAVIDLWPNLQAFARDIRVSYDTAKQMRRRNSIADRHRQAVVEAAEARGFSGISFELLTSTSPRSRERNVHGVPLSYLKVE